VKEQNGKEYWKINNGREREIPARDVKNKLAKEMREELNYRGIELIYYKLPKKYH